MQISQSHSLREFSTFGLSASAREIALLEPSDFDGGMPTPEVAAVLAQRSCVVLGGGSNVVFRAGRKPLVAVMQAVADVRPLTGGELSVWAGMRLDNLVDYALSYQLYGMENLSAIPGSVGGAVVQNAGAYGAEMGDFVQWVEVYDRWENASYRMAAEMCHFGYRSSCFKQAEGRWVIVRVGVRLNSEYEPNLKYRALADMPHATAQELRNSIIDMRWSKLPKPEQYGSVGSFFRNPYVTEGRAYRLKKKYPDMPLYEGGKVSAAWLIDKADWRGKHVGGAGVWEKQPLVLYNRGNCTFSDLRILVEFIQSDVQNLFGISLEMEAIMI